MIIAYVVNIGDVKFVAGFDGFCGNEAELATFEEPGDVWKAGMIHHRHERIHCRACLDAGWCIGGVFIAFMGSEKRDGHGQRIVLYLNGAIHELICFK